MLSSADSAREAVDAGAGAAESAGDGEGEADADTDEACTLLLSSCPFLLLFAFFPSPAGADAAPPISLDSRTAQL